MMGTFISGWVFNDISIIFLLTLTVRLWMMGTLISGWVFRQKVRMEVQMKNTETIPTA